MKKVHGVTKRGQLKITENQVKMLADDVSKHDYENLTAYLSELIVAKHEHFYVKYHLVRKINSGEIYVSRPQMLKAIKYGDLVEVNQTDNKLRLLLRDPSAIFVDLNNEFSKANLCIVLQLDDFSVVTAYYNYVNDNHYNINHDRYDSVDIEAWLNEHKLGGHDEV